MNSIDFSMVMTGPHTHSSNLYPRIADIYRNQTLIYQETMKLLEMVDRHRIQTQKWEGMVNRVNKSIKEMGDIQHFASVIEYDMRDVAVTLANVKHRKIKG
jgi:hypothetical protein